MRSTKGISMISLIITILIIAILAAVMIPSGIDKINSAKLTSFNENILTLKQEASTYLMQNDEYPVKLDGSGNPVVYSITVNSALVAEATKKNDQNDTFYIIDTDKIKLDNKDNGVGKSIDDFYIIAKTSGNVYYAKGQKIGNITYYTKQNKGDGVIATVPTAAPAPNGAYDGRVNAPKLAAGMTAIKWNGSAWVNADTTNANNDWYDYTVGVNKWANVKLADGSMLVWIPRYTYKIISGEHTVSPGVIDVKFSAGTIDDTNNGYRIHPAFYWGGWNIPRSNPMTKIPGGTEVTGIWMGKFETSDNGSSKIQIKPGYTSIRSINIDTMYSKSMSMENTDSATYGILPDRSIADYHMMKNSEWGAASYISKYAMGNIEITLNTDSGFNTSGVNDTTGMGVKNNKSQSTTGNEYGIFDMAGGTWEATASYINTANATNNGPTIVSASEKYKDALPVGVTDSSQDNYNALNMAYGHVLWETSPNTGVFNGTTWTSIVTGWFDDQVSMRYNNWPWIVRGGNNDGGIYAGIFSCYTANGGAAINNTFRITVCVP